MVERVKDGEESDESLVHRFQNGEEQAFNLLALRYRKSVYATAVGMLADEAEAEDLTQEVFIKAYQSLGSFRGQSGFYTWIYRIAVNLSLNQLRKRKLRSFFGLEGSSSTLPARQTADEPTELAEMSGRMREVILSLPEKQRIVFILKHFRGMQHAEIAELLDRDVGTIKANYFQAIRKLRDRLGPYMKGEE